MWDIFHNNRSGPDIGVIANMDILYNTYLRTNPHIVAYGGTGSMICANIKELTEIHIVAYDSVWTDNHAYPMAEIETIANFTPAGNLH